VDQSHLARRWNRWDRTSPDRQPGRAQLHFDFRFASRSNQGFFPITEHEYLLAQSKSNTGSGQTHHQFLRKLAPTDADGREYLPSKSRILLADRQVDPGTGTIRIVAAFPNPGNVLRPGQYGRVRVETSVKKDALLLPQSSVAHLQGSYQVAVVGSGHKVSMRTVKPGATVGTMWVIDEGLKPGEQVSAEGPQKLREGTLVTPKPVHHSGKETKLCQSFSSTVPSWPW